MALSPVVSGSLRAHCIRLHPGDDFVPCLQAAASDALSKSSSTAAFVMTCVGSLDQVTLRMASSSSSSSSSSSNSNSNSNHVEAEESTNLNHLVERKEYFEILSLVGTFAADSAKHLHLCVSDKDGICFGGHLVAGRVFTTVELVLGTIDGVSFEREMDEATGYQELVVSRENVSG